MFQSVKMIDNVFLKAIFVRLLPLPDQTLQPLNGSFICSFWTFMWPFAIALAQFHALDRNLPFQMSNCLLVSNLVACPKSLCVSTVDVAKTGIFGFQFYLKFRNFVCRIMILKKSCLIFNGPQSLCYLAVSPPTCPKLQKRVNSQWAEFRLLSRGTRQMAICEPHLRNSMH